VRPWRSPLGVNLDRLATGGVDEPLLTPPALTDGRTAGRAVMLDWPARGVRRS